MKVNFDKSDRLIELLEDSFWALSGYNYWGAYELNHREFSKPDLYSELVDITKSNIPEEEKNQKRILAFAKAYGHENDLEFGERMLKHSFDEGRILDYLTRAYWQIQTSMTFSDESGSNFSDIAKFRKFIEKWYPEEPRKDVMIDVIRKHEPDVKAIEAEFWANCSGTDKINDWCNIYRERFKNHLREIDEQFYEDVLDGFDETNIYHQYFKDLRLTGLLKHREGDVEARLWHIAQSINTISNKIVELFKSLRASTQSSQNSNQVEQSDKPTDDFKKTSSKETDYITSNGEILTKIHGYCKDSLDGIELIDFLKCVSAANFSKIFSRNGTIKSKLKFTISILNKVIKEPTWYQRASASIGSDPTGCSGANVPGEWKTEMIELANNKKK